jgi:hypothetical protein
MTLFCKLRACACVCLFFVRCGFMCSCLCVFAPVCESVCL